MYVNIGVKTAVYTISKNRRYFMPKTDILIIGSGLAALVIASRLCIEKNVIIFTKSTKYNSNSMLAQGGVAASIPSDDHWISHLNDTMIAGCQHNKEKAVKTLVKTGPTYILDLIKEGMQFDRDTLGRILFGQEGAHSSRRILHAGGDATGKALAMFFFNNIRDHVTIIEHEMAVDLIMKNGICIGVKALDVEDNLVFYFANHVILATGGCGGLFEHSSNDPSIVGDGYAMAYRAGAELVDMEFVQFHPTLLVINNDCKGLISEAVRGDGAGLITENGRRIMKDKHPLQDLAPRDVVSRVLFEEIQKGERIYLDISMIRDFSSRFPTITELCKKNGIVIEDGRIPVIPGAHFMMGGIKVNIHGQSSLPGLYAVGEVACTGVHGANRLASNSLLEGIVFSNLLADFILNQKENTNKTFSEEHDLDYSLKGVELPTKLMVQQEVMRAVGIVRNKKDLTEVIQFLEPYIYFTPQQVGYKKESITILNMMITAWLIASSALKREESRGGHFRSDFSETKQEWNRQVIVRKQVEHALVK
jgi:L-aspartate oxidase